MHHTPSRIVPQLEELLGQVILLSIARSQKKPSLAAWQKLTLADMTPEYLATLDHRNNIGVLLGHASGGLCTIDIDEDGEVEPFLQLNPKLNSTLRTKGQRGCNLWVRIKGDFPSLHQITHRTELDDSGQPRKMGEWRSNGGQTVIWGEHPSGCKYRRLVRTKPVELEFAEINWPDDWRLPWLPTREDNLIKKHGEPYSISSRGVVRLNPVFFAAKYATERLTLWIPSEGRFYQYVAAQGIWRVVTTDQVKLQFAQDIKDFADQVGLPRILGLRSNALLKDLTDLLKGHVERPEGFESVGSILHLGNCMLDLSKDPPARLEFAPTFYSRNQSPFDLVEDAQCPRFLSELLKSALDGDDISLLQRFCGSLLLKRNSAQKLLLLTGTGGTGKSTVVEILERVIGLENCCELRTDLLLERFELSRFTGCTLLSGKDVPGKFLQAKGASALKKLVGHDSLTPEFKGVNVRTQLRGTFGVVITCNSRLHVKLDGDVSAWRRRLLIINYEKEMPKKPVRDFADKLLEAEGKGILLWMIKGAVLHLAELAQYGDFQLTPVQLGRIESLLNESDSVRHFVTERLVADPGSDVTTEELVNAYYDFCDNKGWRALPRREVENQLPDLMLQIHRLNRRNDIQRNNKDNRGYSGVTFKCP